MSDEADQADEQIQAQLNGRLEYVRRQKSLPAIGMCYFCDAPLATHRTFCDAGCREDFDREQEQLKRAGRR